MGDDFGMPDGVTRRLLDPRVQRRDTHVSDLLSLFGFNQQRHGSCATSKEHVSWIQGSNQIEPFEKCFHILVGFDPMVPHALPLLHYVVPRRTQETYLGLSGAVQLIQRAVFVSEVFGVAIPRIAAWTPVVETPRNS